MADGHLPDVLTERNRLPTLEEVLQRRTTAPVDLFSFYIYMRDQQRSVDYLDFWLDVSQHMQLCRHYVRELRRSVLLGTPDLEKAGSMRSSQMLENFDLREPGTAASVHSVKTEDQRISAMLRQETGSNHSQKASSDSRPSTGRPSSPEQLPRPSFMSSNFGLGRDCSSPNESTPANAVARGDIRSSAEKVLYTYLLPGSEREIILPPGILNDITESIEGRGRDDPEVFDLAKEYVYQAMERDAFPGFLRSKALGNLVPPSLMLRLVLGLLAMFGAFWAAFILIFTNESRATRCWLVLPFTVGVYALTSHQYTLDPILALLGFSEYTFFNFTQMREPFVRSLLRKRSIMVISWIVLITAAICCLFIFVPGKHL